MNILGIKTRFVLFCVLIFSTPFVFKKDFKPPPRYTIFPFHSDWELPPPSDQIVNILSSRFYYFAQGNQSSVFVSEDGNYVLKLFRYQRSLFPFVQWIKNRWKHKPKLGLKAKIEKTLNATHLAFQEGREFTRVVYCHLNLTENLLPITECIVGKKIYRFPLDYYRFALQQKVEPFKKTLLEARDNPEKIHRLMNSFAKLLLDRSQKNIQNSDPNLEPNFGFFDDKAVEIDFGNYQKIDPHQHNQKKEISQFLISLEQLLAIYAPEHLPFAIDLRIKTEMVYDGLDEAPEVVQ